jgi:tetratricopeptide (TPR) repeat protein
MNDRIAQLTRMLEREPGDSFCLYGLAQEHAKRGEPAQAIRYFDEAIAVDPSHAYAYFHKARCEEGLGNIEAAKVTLSFGLKQAVAKNDAQAAREIRAYIDELS